MKLVESYLQHEAHLGRSEATIDSSRRALTRFFKRVGIEDPRDATTERIARYAGEVQAGLALETAYLYIRTVKAFFRHLAESHKLLMDPAEGVPLPRLKRGEVGRILAQEEVDLLLEACGPLGTAEGLRDRALIEFEYATALRASEVRHVELGDVDLGRQVVKVRLGKGRKDRVVPLGSAAMEWLKRYLEEGRPRLVEKRPDAECNDALFVTNTGLALSDATLRIVLKGIADRAKLTFPFNPTCHAFRRTVATRMLANGASPGVVAALLGHEDLGSLSRYVRFAAREVKAAHAKAHPREATSR